MCCLKLWHGSSWRQSGLGDGIPLPSSTKIKRSKSLKLSENVFLQISNHPTWQTSDKLHTHNGWHRCHFRYSQKVAPDNHPWWLPKAEEPNRLTTSSMAVIWLRFSEHNIHCLDVIPDHCSVRLPLFPHRTLQFIISYGKHLLHNSIPLDLATSVIQVPDVGNMLCWLLLIKHSLDSTQPHTLTPILYISGLEKWVHVYMLDKNKYWKQ